MGVLEIRELALSVPGRPILDVQSLHVEQGETVGLVGESGSGKSVTSRAALGMFPEHATVGGKVMVDGLDVLQAGRSELRRLRTGTAAMIFQDPRASINPTSRIGEFMTEGMLAGGADRRSARRRAAELLSAVGIRDPERALQSYPHQFSGGMLQRVVIAAAVAIEPKLILADEPTTMLDVTTQAEVIAHLVRMQADQRTGMLFVTHNLELAAAICDRIYVMYSGRIVEMQSAAALFDQPRHPYTRALIGATPRLDDDAVMEAIPGRPLALYESPEGCSFSQRCPHRQDRCDQAVPPLVDRGQGVVACLRDGELEYA